MYYGDVNSDGWIDMGDVLLAQRIADFNVLYPPVAVGERRWDQVYFAGYGIRITGYSYWVENACFIYWIRFDETGDIQYGPFTEQQVLDQMGMTVDVLLRADVDGDGVVTQADVTLIQQYIMGTITQFPVEVVTPPGGNDMATIATQGQVVNDGNLQTTFRVHLYTQISDENDVRQGAPYDDFADVVLAKAATSAVIQLQRITPALPGGYWVDAWVELWAIAPQLKILAQTPTDTKQVALAVMGHLIGFALPYVTV